MFIYFDVFQVVEIDEAASTLLTALRPNMVALVDAFEFPDSTLNSALGRYDGNVYESVYAAAAASPLNSDSARQKVFAALTPHLDKDFIREHARMVRCVFASKL